MKILFDNLEEGQFFVTIDSHVFKCYDGYQGIDDTEMLKRISELEIEECMADEADKRFMAGYYRHEEINWLLQHRENVQIAPTIHQYFRRKESLKEVIDLDNLPF